MLDRVNADGSARAEEGNASRVQFVEQLPARLGKLRAQLRELPDALDKAEAQHQLLRRYHALGAAARLLGFDRVAEQLGATEKLLKIEPSALHGGHLEQAEQQLERIPSLLFASPAAGEPGALDADPSQHSSPAESAAAIESAATPRTVVAHAQGGLEHDLRAALAPEHAEVRASTESTEVLAMVSQLSPDVVLVDVDLPGARELLTALVDRRTEPALAETKSPALVAVGSFDRPDAAALWVHAGAERVVPKPVSAGALSQALDAARHDNSGPRPFVERLEDVTVDELAAAVASEVRRGLAEAVMDGGRDVRIRFDGGADVLATVWGAVARIRELAVLRSGGKVSFDPRGPEGALVAAPWAYDQPGSSPRPAARGGVGVSLRERTIIVADDDPAITWFLSSVLVEAGARVLEARDGERAYALACEHWPDLVISDILMPELDGFGLCRSLKQDPALSDVPVVLVSWKEDLLRRVRELGVGADGFLLKDATAQAIQQRASEALTRRARVEARLEGSREVHGRLDGLTPRLILDLVCRRELDARVSFRDAAFLYEVEARGGVLVSACRTSDATGSQTGLGVLTPLVGVRAGRFSVLPATAPITPEFEGTARDLLREPSARARRAQRVLRGGALDRVSQVVIDTLAMAPYAAASPPRLGAALEELFEGAPPRTLVGSLGADGLDHLLRDLAWRGAVLQVLDDAGNELLDELPEPGEFAAPSAPLRAAAAVEPRAPEPFSNEVERRQQAETGAEAVEVSAAPDLATAQTAAAEPELEAPLTSGADASVVVQPAADALAFEAKAESAAVPSAIEAEGLVGALLATPEAEAPQPSQAVASEPVGAAAAEVPTPSPVPVLTPGFPKTFSAEVRDELGSVPLPEVSEQPSPLPMSIDAPAPVEAGLKVKRIDFARVRAQAEAKSEPHGRSKRFAQFAKRARRAAGPLGMMLGAGVLAFYGSRQVYDRLGTASVEAPVAVSQPDAPPNAPEPRSARGTAPEGAGLEAAPEATTPEAAEGSEPSAPPQPPAVAAPNTEDFSQRTAALPEGVGAPAGKGMLEIRTAPGHKIYVAGVFIGRGPVRRVPIQPGSHRIQVRFEGREADTQASVLEGRRTLVTYAAK